jgi:CHAT domain-containing protein
MVISAMGFLAEMQLAVGRHADVIALVEPVLKEPDEAMTRMEVFLRVHLARAYAAVGRLDDAAREAEQAVLLGEADDRPNNLLHALDRRARVRLARQDGPGASADAQRAIALLERLRATLPPRDFVKQGFGNTGQQVSALAIDVRVHMRDASGALVAAEQARARAFQDLLATREQLGHTAPAGASTEALPSGATAEPPDLAGLKALVVRLGSPLLAYWVAPHQTFVWVVTPGGALELRTVQVEADRLEALALAASAGPAGASARGSEWRELYDLLIKPVRSVLESAPATGLTVIPHGPLFRVSFAALQDERGQYLVERYELHYAPAAGVLRFTERNRHTSRVRRALLVADPALPQTASGETLLPLAGARLEIADAARRLGPGSAVLIGRQATESRVRELIAGRDVLHFATHGIVSDRDPLASYLAFASSGAEAEADGRLTAAEIYALDISADLVVLSACRSGAGKVTGDGIIGLTRGFFYAGAPSVLATLWDLADEPAQFTMRRFYTHWRAGGTKAAALRAAQRDLIRALRAGAITAQTPFGPTRLTESPALWASFVLLGEP